MKLRFFSMMFALGLLFSLPALALDLHEARQAGIVGETLSGYIAALKETPESAALVKDVNAKRLQEYTRISRENNQPVDVVAKLAAPQIANKLGSGEYYQDAQGNWQRHP